MEENKIEEVAVEKNNPFMVLGGVVALALVVGIIFFATKGNTSKTASETAKPVANMTEETSAPEVAGTSTGSAALDMTAKQITVEAGAFYYKPNTIKVKKGEKVQIVLKSVDMMHDFNIDELNVHSPIVKSGTENTVTFTADKVGKFEYYCSVGQHRKNGQVGTIEVTN
ncbi:cupredoxin domain-containing protein [Candidatus Woesebacteria bacterium]|nr:cupredoxin domain-containing protein [Candidatus Woesebacteria bacterium]MBP9687110.1 cupredoxin domain-containing protein [Candidatus Woesebacteria bacterium]